MDQKRNSTGMQTGQLARKNDPIKYTEIQMPQLTFTLK